MEIQGQLRVTKLGRRLTRTEPDASCGEFDDGEDVSVVLLVSCDYSPVMLEL